MLVRLFECHVTGYGHAHATTKPQTYSVYSIMEIHGTLTFLLLTN